MAKNRLDWMLLALIVATLIMTGMMIVGGLTIAGWV
jgi:hypothetical protein